jgi:hypothetical protein
MDVAIAAVAPTAVYPRAEAAHLAALYWQYAPLVGLDPAVAWAQLMLETGRIDPPSAGLASWWCLPGRWNFAGIGVTSATALARPNTGVWQQDGAIWREGIAFSSATQGVMAHIGRLIAYAMPPTQYTPAQAWAVGIALDWRLLPARYHGAAGTIEEFGGGVWAKDTRYAAKWLQRLAGLME